MSSYRGFAIHPDTGETRAAWFVDDFFGPHKYGVCFEGEGRFYREEEIEAVPMPPDPPAKEREG